MDNSLIGIIGLLIAFLLGLFINRKNNQRDADIIDLTKKIENNKKEVSLKQQEADKKVQEYLEELKKYDPNFNDDDNGGTPSA